MVTASVTASVSSPAEGCVFLQNSGSESSKFSVSEVIQNFGGSLRIGSVSGHIEIEHGVNGNSTVLVIVSDGLASKKSNFFGGIPLEFNSVSWNEGRSSNNTKDFQEQ